MGRVPSPIGHVAALCWTAARTSALIGLVIAADDLVEELTAGTASNPRWASIVSHWQPVRWEESGLDDRCQLLHDLTDVLFDVTIVCLAAEMVSDLADDSVLMRARGPWLSGLLEMGNPPGREWNGAPAVLETLRALLAPLGAHDLHLDLAVRQFAAAAGGRCQRPHLSCRRRVDSVSGMTYTRTYERVRDADRDCRARARDGGLLPGARRDLSAR